MTTKKLLTAPGIKATEIEMLENLMSIDGYFADTFFTDDLQKMKDNINNDFPILMGTSQDESARISRLQGTNVGLEDKLIEANATKDGMANRILDLEKENACLQNTLAQVLVDLLHIEEEYKVDLTSSHFTSHQTLTAKVNLGMTLTEDERKAIVIALERL